MSRIFILFLLAGLECLIYAQEEDCFCVEEILSAQNLTAPTFVLQSPDNTGRQFISDRPGKVWILMPNGTRFPEPFLDITLNVYTLGECGFSSMAFHPDYINNRKFYVNYCTVIDTTLYSRWSEIQTLVTDPNKADPNTERILYDFYQPHDWHNAADMFFGLDDGYLYFGLGDGGFSGDPQNHAQNKSTFLGSIIRVDVDTRNGSKEWGIPPDNPYLDDPEALPELYAIGLRNPWKMSMDAGDRETGAGRGRIFTGDVGQNTYEEVDLIVPGGNYGWSGREGFECYSAELCGFTEPEVLPLLAYNHSVVGSCVIGGYVYRGCLNPNFNGWYFFADCFQKRMFRLIETDPDVYDWKQVNPCAVCRDGLSNEYFNYIQSFGTDSDGEVYFVAVNDYYEPTSQTGRLYRIHEANSTAPACT